MDESLIVIYIAKIWGTMLITATAKSQGDDEQLECLALA